MTPLGRYSVFYLMGGLIVIATIFFVLNPTVMSRPCSSSNDDSAQTHISTNIFPDEMKRIQQQRDDLSSAMMRLSREYHQYQCNVTSPDISSHGGWCVSKHHTDSDLASALARLFQGETVASFGDGAGAYKKLVDDTGLVQLYDSYDGAPFCENNTAGMVKYLDLTIPAYGLRLYDWVLCLEVGEHVPEAHEQTLLDNIARHARKGVVLSWAIPDQRGKGHVNCQPLEYIIKQMDDRGFAHNDILTRELQNNSTNKNLKRNTNVYIRQSNRDVNRLMV